MINKDDLDKLRQYLTRKGVADLHNSDCYLLNGLEIIIDAGYGGVFVYLARDKWLIACTNFMPRTKDNPHRVIVLDIGGLMRLLEGGEMAYNNMEIERYIDRLEG